MKSFIKSVTYALDGLFSALKTETNLRIHIVAMFIVMALGFYLKLSITEWGIIILVTGFVLVSELFNTRAGNSERRAALSLGNMHDAWRSVGFQTG